MVRTPFDLVFVQLPVLFFTRVHSLLLLPCVYKPIHSMSPTAVVHETCVYPQARLGFKASGRGRALCSRWCLSEPQRWLWSSKICSAAADLAPCWC